MIVLVRFNMGPAAPLELQQGALVAELQQRVAAQQGVPAEHLRVLFAGRELRSTLSLQACELPEQSTVHVVLPPSGSSRALLLLQEEPGGLTRLDLCSSRLPPTSSSLEGGDGAGGGAAGGDGAGEELQAAGLKGERTCSTLFVYCKRCRSVQPGKLRVCCRSCKETTMKISRGPSCWDDVLLPGRVHGLCQSDGCHGNEAEFYMKCASHPTSEDDLSVALDLIVTNRRDVPCIGCCDITDVVLVFQCAERHVICLDCFHRYCRTRLRERQFVSHPVIGYSLPCAAGCVDSLIKELHHFRILGEDEYARYQRYGAEQCLLLIGGLLCPAAGCGAGLIPPDGSSRVRCDRRLGCGFVFCKYCREAYHEGACLSGQAPPTAEASQGGVEVEEEAALRGRWDAASLVLLQESTRRCPQCRVPVERDGGCMHMHCPLCRAEWCWLCGVAWNTDCMGNHWFG